MHRKTTTLPSKHHIFPLGLVMYLTCSIPIAQSNKQEFSTQENITYGVERWCSSVWSWCIYNICYLCKVISTWCIKYLCYVISSACISASTCSHFLVSMYSKDRFLNYMLLETKMIANNTT
jgi:hypothetical protein